MYLIDILIIILLIASFWKGFRRGFVLQFISLISVIASLVITYQFHPVIADMIAPLFQFQEVHEVFALPIPIEIPVNSMAATAVAFVLLFFLCRMGFMLVGNALNMVASLPLLNSVNRIAGILLSLAETIVILVLLINIASMLPIESVQNILAESSICQYTITELGFVREKMIEILNTQTV